MLKIDKVFDSSKVSLMNKSAICYKKNLYKFEDLENIPIGYDANLNVIEETLFSYENELEILFDKLESKKRILNTEARRIVEIILSLKRRNPKFQSSLSKSEADRILKKHVDAIVKAYNQSTLLQSKVPNLLAEIDRRLVNRGENFENDLYRRMILSGETKNSEFHEHLIDFILNCEFAVLFAPLNNPFILSDNPGFTLDENDNISNTGFEKSSRFLFPLSPRAILHVNLRKKNDSKTIFKKVINAQTDNMIIYKFNLASTINSSEKIMSNYKAQLETFKQLILESNNNSN